MYNARSHEKRRDVWRPPAPFADDHDVRRKDNTLADECAADHLTSAIERLDAAIASRSECERRAWPCLGHALKTTLAYSTAIDTRFPNTVPSQGTDPYKHSRGCTDDALPHPQSSRTVAQ